MVQLKCLSNVHCTVKTQLYKNPSSIHVELQFLPSKLSVSTANVFPIDTVGDLCNHRAHSLFTFNNLLIIQFLNSSKLSQYNLDLGTTFSGLSSSSSSSPRWHHTYS